MVEGLLAPIVFIGRRQELALVLGPLTKQPAPIMVMGELVLVLRLFTLGRQQLALPSIIILVIPRLEVKMMEADLGHEVVLVGLSFVRIGSMPPEPMVHKYSNSLESLARYY